MTSIFGGRGPEDGPIASVLVRGWRCLAALLWLSLVFFAGGAAAQEVMFSSGTYRVNEGDTLRPELVLSHSRSEDVTVRVEALDLGEAQSGEDFAADPWSVTIPAGQTRHSFSIATVDDDNVEGTEQFLLHIAPYGHSPGVQRSSDGNADAVVTINDDSRISLHESDYFVWEGGTAKIRVVIENPKLAAFTLDYTLSGGTASGADVVGGFGTHSVTVPANARQLTIPIRTVQDTVQDEDTETFSVRLSTSEPGIVFGRGITNVSISDDDTEPTMTFASSSSSANEGAGTHHVTVKLSPAPTRDSALVFLHSYTAIEHPGRSGTATRGADYEIPAIQVGQTAVVSAISVPAGATTVTVPVTVIDDRNPEGNETVKLRLGFLGKIREAPRRIPLAWHTLTIVDDDVQASFASASKSMDEGSGTHNVTVNLAMSPTSPVTLNYNVGGTATPGSDYAALSGTLSVPAGEKTATIPVTVIDDSDPEGNETVVLTLTGSGSDLIVSPDSYTLTIVDNEVSVSFASASQHVREGSGTRDVTVNLTPPSSSPITLNYTVGGTATPDSDFTIANSGTLSVPAGAKTATIPVTIIDDSMEDSGETIVLTLVGSGIYRVANPGTHTLNIDFLPLVSFKDAILGTVYEWRTETRNVRVDLTPPSSSPITLNYTVGGTATPGLDFTIANSGTLSVPAGAKTATIPVTIIDDSVEDSGETIVLTLVGGTGYRVVSKGNLPWNRTNFWKKPWIHHVLTIHNHESSDLEGLVQAQLDVAVADGDSASANLWRRALAAVRGEAPPNGLAPLTAADAQALSTEHAGKGDIELASLWAKIAGVIGDGTTPPPPAEPEVTIAAGASPVTEGGDAVFTVTASPAPASPLAVTVTVAADGDYGIAGGDRTVTIPATGSATLTLATTNDDANEPDGSVTVTVEDGDGYIVGSSASGTVAIADNDDATLPAVTISAGASPVTEGGDTLFTLTANPVPSAPLSVTVAVAADGDYGIAGGDRTVTIPATGSATLTLTLATTNDDADEPDGSVTVTVKDGEGYTVGSSASGTVAIADDDPTPPTTTGVDPALIAQVRGYAAETHEGQAHVDRWRRVLAAFGDDNGYTAMTAAEAQTHADRGWQRWVPVAAALAALEAATEPEQPLTLPALSVSAGADVTEGGDAVFTVTATPAPAAELAVSVTVAADGAYGVTAGSRTVTVPTGGSATLTLATTSDDTDEPDGSVTATVAAGEGYTVGDPASGSVSIQDDDEPPPVEPAVTIAAGASPVTEGGDATFTLTASPAPASPLTVSVTAAADGAYGITAGKRTVTIPTAGSATLTLATTSDDTDEPDGSVTVTLNDGEGYTVGAPASDTISIEDDDLPPPVVTVTASTAPVTEGGDAVFTVSASRAPDADLAVALEVADAPDSDFVAGGDEGERTVTIPDGATSVVFTLATVNDEADEPDGSVTVTLKAGDGYTVGTPASDTLSIEDDDLPPPVVSIAAKAASVTEGGTATFTLTADRAPAADLTVTLAVSETGDHVAAETEGAATAVIAKGETQAAFSVATVNDDADEPDGVVTVTLEAGEGYTVSASQGAATVTVSDDDAAPGPMLSVDDVTVTEGAWMEFTVRLSAPSAGGVSVKVSTRDSTPASATARDYWPLSGRTVSFRAGETERSVGVIVYDDSHDEGSETFEMVLSDARGAPIGDGVAVGTIVNDDPMPAAWLARLGRTVAEQALDGIAGRIAAPRTPGMQGTLAGRALDFGAPDHGHAGPDHPPAGAPALGGTGSVALSDAVRGFASHSGRLGTGDDAAGVGGGFGEAQSHAMTAREALLGSSFTLTGETDASGGSMAFWGRGSQSRFDGREGTFSLDGEVTTGMLGADYARDEWLVGLALAQSTGEGGYRDTGVSPRPDGQSCPDAMDAAARALCAGAVRAGDGKVEASLTAALPYASLQASNSLKLWGAAGLGSGEVTLKTAMGGRYRSDTTWRMAAAGLRGDLLTPPTEGSGPALALTSDALWARTSSEKTRHLAASKSDATRLRLGLEGSWRMALDGAAPGAESGASLTPKLEVGARHDGGDAETGFGIELGAGIAWVDPALGLTLDVSGRTLLAHEDGDLEDRGYAASLGFDPRPASERGPSLSLRQELGARATGGLDALFAPAPLDDRTDSEATGRWSLEAAYGFRAFGGRYTGSPHVGLGLSAAARDYSLGGRWTPAESAPDLAFAVKATRRESDSAAPEHTVGFEVRATW